MNKGRSLISLVLLLVAATLVLSLGYGLAKGINVRVGMPGDALYVRDFNGDEAPRFRWAKDDSSLVFDDLPAGALNNADVVVEMAALDKATLDKMPPNSLKPVTLLLNGVAVGTVTPKPGLPARYSFVAKNVPDASSATLELQTTALSPPGDSRKLGPFVTRAELHFGQKAGFGPFGLPTWSAVLWTWLLAAGLFFAVRRGVRIIGAVSAVKGVNASALSAAVAFVLTAIVLAVPLVPNPLNPLWYAPLLSWAALAAWSLFALLTLPMWARELADLPGYLDSGAFSVRGRRVYAGDALMLAILVAYAVFGLWIAFTVPFIGHADYADNAVVARNLVAGKGYSVDYVAQFYNRYPAGITHAADTWPLLQPTLIAPFFAIFGPTVWAAKLPNVILMLLLAWVIYSTGRHYVGRAAGILAAVLTLASPLFFDSVAYPINDLAFSLFLWLGATTIYRAVERPPLMGAASETADAGVAEGQPSRGNRARAWAWRSITSPYVQGGLWLGLLMLTKPSGAIPAAAILGWGLIRRLTVLRRIAYGRLRGLLVAGIIAAVVLSPYLIRNQLQFGKAVYSTESYDAFVIDYIPWENIYDLYKPAYASNSTLPQVSDLTADGVTTKLSTQWRDFTGDIGDGSLANPFLLVLAVIGMALGVQATGQRKRSYALAALFVCLLGATMLFLGTYWHYEPRYFQPFLPWLYLFACSGLLHGAAILRTWLRASARQEHWTMNLLAPVAFAFLFVPLAATTYAHFGPAVGQSGVVATTDWMRANLPATAVVMTRNPWEITFHSGLKTVMIPNKATLDDIRAVAKEYGVTYIQLDHLGDTDPGKVWHDRTALKPLLVSPLDPNVAGFKKVYDSGGKDPFVIYELLP